MTAGRASRISLSPVEGWLTLAMVAAMSLCLAWSLNGAAWVLGRPVLTSFLPYASLGGVAWGFISAKVGWPRWLAQLLGVVFAALLLPIMVGGILLNGDFTPRPAFVATANSTVEAYLDLASRGLALTEQYGHFMLVLGILCWGTAQFASYAVFGHHRPFSAVMFSGIALVVNMSITLDQQLAILVWFSLAALVLLIRAHALDERTTWLRHRLGDAGSLSAIYLRAGSAFIGIAVVGALVLTNTASSAPLNGIGNGLDEKLVEATQWIQAVFRGGGPGLRFTSDNFGDTAEISGSWTDDGSELFQVAVPNGESGDYHWRDVAYDTFDGQSTWSISSPVTVSVAAGGPLLAGTLDQPGPAADRTSASFTVHELAIDLNNIVAPDAPTGVTIDTTSHQVGHAPDASLGRITKQGSSDYTVTAEVPIDYTVDPVHGLTANQLRVAGTDFPAALKPDFYQLPTSVSTSPVIKGLLTTIMDTIPTGDTNEYDVSTTIQDYLRNSANFKYNRDVRSFNCTDGIVQCFIETRQGYCQYYASTMVVLLRMLGYPARMAEGYLPSKVVDGVETIPASAAHAWAEVYFPHYGWITFDPTGGGIGDPPNLPGGPVVAPLPSAPPAPSLQAVSGSNDAQKPIKKGGENNPLGAIAPDTSGTGGFVVVGLLLAVIMAALVFLAWQRGPRTAQEPDRVYRGVVGLARRLGFGPRPNQTVYEYAGDLGDILPAARPDLQTVARAKVEVAYGRRTLSPDRIEALARAQRHLRVVLLGLVFRRAERRAQRRRS